MLCTQVGKDVERSKRKGVDDNRISQRYFDVQADDPIVTAVTKCCMLVLMKERV